MKLNYSLLALTALSLIFLNSCIKIDDNPEKDYGYAAGIFIVNEGAFGNSNGSISWYNPDSSKVINHLFTQVNGRPLGDVVLSFTKSTDKGYIVVNNSQKLEIVDLKTFNSIDYIDQINYPRYVMLIDQVKAYLTTGNFDGQVLVINLFDNLVVDTIKVGNGPEHMFRFHDKVIVANSGGWVIDSTLSVINTVTDEVEATWFVGYNPADLVKDAYNHLWVLCKGKVEWGLDWTLEVETQTELVEVDPENGEVLRRFSIGETGDYFWPEKLAIDPSGKMLYYTENGGFYQFNIDEKQVSPMPFIGKMFYGFGIESHTRIIYGLEAKTFTSSGYLFRYSKDGAILDSVEVGIGPNQVIF